MRIFLLIIIIYPFLALAESPNYYEAELETYDSWRDAKEDEEIDFEVELDYVNSKGEESSRRVSVYNVFEFNGKQYISGFCHLRQDDRTFRLDRVVNIVETKSNLPLIVK